MPCSYRSGGKHFKAYISHLTKYQVSPSFQGLKIAANTLVCSFPLYFAQHTSLFTLSCLSKLLPKTVTLAWNCSVSKLLPRDLYLMLNGNVENVEILHPIINLSPVTLNSLSHIISLSRLLLWNCFYISHLISPSRCLLWKLRAKSCHKQHS